MDSGWHLLIEDLQKLCDERQEESFKLEFKCCNELRPGTPLRGTATRTRDGVIDELTKDITALLNSAGGTIIYGILERDSRAKEIDRNHAFGQGDIPPEKVVQWLRAHVQPSPTVDVYRVFEHAGDPDSPWYLVIEALQGQQAYMARDHRFYRRIGDTVRQMEQYEVVDAMNRTQGALLAIRLRVSDQSQPVPMERSGLVPLEIAVTSSNFIASEYGAVTVTAAHPIRLINDFTRPVFRSCYSNPLEGLHIEGEDYAPNAQLVKIRWGVSTGTVILPGDWHILFHRPVLIQVPPLSSLPDPTYLIQTELFTMNMRSKQNLFCLRKQSSGEGFEIQEVEPSQHTGIMASFWHTYHAAREKLQKTGAS